MRAAFWGDAVVGEDAHGVNKYAEDEDDNDGDDDEDEGRPVMMVVMRALVRVMVLFIVATMTMMNKATIAMTIIVVRISSIIIDVIARLPCSLLSFFSAINSN